MTPDATRINPARLLTALAVLVAVAGAAPAPAALAPTDTLALVNGDPITVAEFDQLVMEAHRKFEAPQQGVGMFDEILEKRIRDYLIIQDALAAGYDEVPEFQEMLAEKETEYAVQSYVKDNLELPTAADPDSVRTEFERYYWRIQYRRISVRTREEAVVLLARVRDGEDMGELAQELSLDTKKLLGGLSNVLYWRDVENRIRDQVRGLEVGEYSAIFPYNDAFSFVRVEQLLPLDEDAFAKYRPEIAVFLHGQARQRAWEAWVKEQETMVNVSEDLGALAVIIADSAVVTTGEFLKEQPAIVIGIPDGPGITGTELRRAISHAAMKAALEPFGRHLATARWELKGELVLGYLAQSLGYGEHPEVVARVEKDWEKWLIEQYLNDTVAAKIRFDREEFQEFYDENLDRFRGPEEVRLDIMFLETEEDAVEASLRLNEGADFGYIFKQYNPGQEIAVGQAAFIKIDELSRSFRDEMDHMDIGDSSNPVQMPMGWMVFKLDARRPGAVPPLGAVEMDIRRVIYARKFQEILDEQIAVLTEGSEIRYWPERIAEYLQPVGEGR